MIDIEIQISISERSSVWAINCKLRGPILTQGPCFSAADQHYFIFVASFDMV